MQRPSPSRILWICGLSSITPTPALSHFLQPPNLFSESLPQAKFFEASEAWRGSMWSRNYPSRRADPIESRPSSIGSMCFDHAKDADSCFPGRLDTETTGWTFQAVWLTWLWKKSGNPPLQTKKKQLSSLRFIRCSFPRSPWFSCTIFTFRLESAKCAMLRRKSFATGAEVSKNIASHKGTLTLAMWAEQNTVDTNKHLYTGK